MYVYICIYGMCTYIYMEDFGPARKRRQLGRRDSEETINRAIEKHFGHLPQEIHSMECIWYDVI